nr:chemotaxis-specific protein-glutamate methyltransferase CheB [Eubacterium sp.]
MKKILIIDDSALMRRVMSDIIQSEADVCVADIAENGFVAAQYIVENRQYDCILVDINMPKMDGIAFLQFLKEKQCMIPTLVVSSIASRSAKETIRALELGAYDFVRKPGQIADTNAKDDFATQLMQKIRCSFEINNSVMHEEKKQKQKSLNSSAVKTGKKEVERCKHEKGDIIFIASSTGGPKALQSVIPKFSPDIGCPIVVVQHMPAGFTRSLADRLNEMSSCKVIEAEDGMVLENGIVYIAKGGFQLSVSMNVKGEHYLSVKKDEPRNGLRPCADIFLESLLDSGYRNVLCGVLTGMGSDGTNGLVQLKKMKKVYTVSQSESTCVVYGMPRSAEKEGVVDIVADLQDIAHHLMYAKTK